MNIDIDIVACELENHTITFETGLLAGLASGAVTARCGDSVAFCAVVLGKEPREGCDFLPLTVDYTEKTYAAGKIPGGFFKREGRPTTKEILTCRLIDRPVRPMFPEHFHNEVQVVNYVLSYDKKNQVDTLAMNAASCALMISEAPIMDAIGAVRVCKVDGKLVANPTPEQIEASTIEMIVAGTSKAISMVECGSKEVSEEELLEALAFAHEIIKKITAAQKELAAKVGKAKIQVPVPEPEPQVEEIVGWATEGIRDALNTADKAARIEKFKGLELRLAELLVEKLGEETAATKHDACKRIFGNKVQAEMRRMILEENKRIDGRGLADVRPISSAVGFLPRAHGSSLFTRGQTQALGVVTLGGSRDSQIIDGLDDEERKRFLLHYNFPPFSVGEARPMRGPGRREVGHGALAERALSQVIPSVEDFPYTIRMVSEVLSSNGSSSMAAVCSGSLAMMDAGIPIKTPVAGIAMGLIKEGENFKVLSDILGDEDHFGDMDFKVAGTQNGINALQMDIKIAGVTLEILRTALAQARDGRMHILSKMQEVIEAPREELSKHAPRIVTIQIDTDKIRTIIGPGGKTIRKITEDTGVDIETNDDGRILILSPDMDANDRAIAMIRELTEDAEVGQTYKGKVKRIMKFGAFVEILPGIEGMVHISQLDRARVNRVEDIVDIGDEVTVKVVEIDGQGRVNLSRKAVLEEEAK